MVRKCFIAWYCAACQCYTLFSRTPENVSFWSWVTNSRTKHLDNQSHFSMCYLYKMVHILLGEWSQVNNERHGNMSVLWYEETRFLINPLVIYHIFTSKYQISIWVYSRSFTPKFLTSVSCSVCFVWTFSSVLVTMSSEGLSLLISVTKLHTYQWVYTTIFKKQNICLALCWHLND